uniref:CW domain-containing protein n=1 Tax=Caenorhabditis japonica TaxID=281687 RepID=A0A8R1HYA7_CAEJA
MAWQNGSTCTNFDYYVMGTVSQTNSTAKSIVAFKVNNPNDECPIGSSAPTFNNTNATGTLYIDDDPNYFPVYVYYTIYSTASSWKISYNVNGSCVGGFQDYVQHSDGTALCVAVS